MTYTRSGPSTLSIAAAFLLRDFQIASSYRIPFVFDVMSVFFLLIEFFFVARLIPQGEVLGGYFPFAAAGLVVSAFLTSTVTVIATNTRQEQVQGTLEVTLSSGLRGRQLAVGILAYPLVSACVRSSAYVAIAALLGARARGANWPLAGAALLLGSISFAGIGLVAVATVLVFRQALAAAGWIIGLSAFLAGTVFPLRILPSWLRGVSSVSPVTQTLFLVRKASLGAAGWSDSFGRLGVLGAMAMLSIGVGAGALAWSLHRVRATGGLAQY